MSKRFVILFSIFIVIFIVNSCKKNEEVEPPQLVTITGSVTNNITGDLDNTEVNDTIHVVAQGTADAEKTSGFDTFRPVFFESNTRSDFLNIPGGLNPGEGIEYTVTLDGDEWLIPFYAGKTFDIRIQYRISGNAEMQYKTIATVNITAEHGLISVGETAHGIVKNNIVYLSELLSSDPGVVNSNGTHPTYEQFVNGFTILTDGDLTNHELKDIRLNDQNNLWIYEKYDGAVAYLIPESTNGEKIMFNLGILFGIR